MERPTLQKPREQQWQEDEDKLQELLNFIKNEAFNIEAYRFWCPGDIEWVTYKQLMDNINSDHKVISFQYMSAMRQYFRTLPAELTAWQKEIFSHFRRFMMTLEERQDYIIQLEQYADACERDMEEMQDQIKDLERERNAVKILSENIELNAKVEALKEMLIAQGKPAEEVKKIIETPEPVSALPAPATTEEKKRDFKA